MFACLFLVILLLLVVIIARNTSSTCLLNFAKNQKKGMRINTRVFYNINLGTQTKLLWGGEIAASILQNYWIYFEVVTSFSDKIYYL